MTSAHDARDDDVIGDVDDVESAGMGIAANWGLIFDGDMFWIAGELRSDDVIWLDDVIDDVETLHFSLIERTL